MFEQSLKPCATTRSRGMTLINVTYIKQTTQKIVLIAIGHTGDEYPDPHCADGKLAAVPGSATRRGIFIREAVGSTQGKFV